MSEEFTAVPPVEAPTEATTVDVVEAKTDVAAEPTAPKPDLGEGVNPEWDSLDTCPNGHGALDGVHRNAIERRPSRITWAYHCLSCGARWQAVET